MTNRIVLDNSGLRISKPGVDVLSAGPTGLMFNSTWEATGVFLSGAVYIPPNSQVDIWFGRTFAVAPFLFTAFHDGADWVLPQAAYYQGTPSLANFTAPYRWWANQSRATLRNNTGGGATCRYDVTLVDIG